MIWLRRGLTALTIAKQVRDLMSSGPQANSSAAELQENLVDYMLTIHRSMQAILEFRVQNPAGAWAALTCLETQVERGWVAELILDPYKRRRAIKTLLQDVEGQKAFIEADLRQDERERAAAALAAIAELREMDLLLADSPKAQELYSLAKDLNQLQANQPAKSSLQDWKRQKAELEQRQAQLRNTYNVERYNLLYKKYYAHGSRAEFDRAYKERKALVDAVFANIPHHC